MYIRPTIYLSGTLNKINFNMQGHRVKLNNNKENQFFTTVSTYPFER